VRVLVVDDVPAMRRFLQMALASLREASIEEAGDGVQALRLLTENRYDLVLLDLNLPLLDGMKVLAKLRSSEPATRRTPVIIVSTVHDEELLARARSLGSVHILPKPVEAFRLLALLRELLHPPESTAQTYERRQGRRRHLSVALRFGDDEVVDAQSWDISATGAFFATEHLKPVGSRLSATLYLPHLDHPVQLECEVVHIRLSWIGVLPVGMGVKFVNTTAEVQRHILRVLASPTD
jgi:two-component system chemotaxis response regulator CheY